MGLCYDLVCTKCGYKYFLMYGRGGDDQPAIDIENRLKSREKDDEATKVYWAMDKPHVDYDTRPYHCYDCKDFFHYNRIKLWTLNGNYYSECRECPVCSGYKVHPIELESLEGKEEYGYGECDLECPKCGQKLVIKNAGIAD